MGNLKVVIINGSGGSGKDTFVKAVSMTDQEIYNEKYLISTDIIDQLYYIRKKNQEPCCILNISSIDPIKKIAKESFNWDGVKNEKSRKLLSDLKRIAIEFSDIPFDYILKKYNQTKTNDIKNNILFVHIREIDEIEKLKTYIENDNFADVFTVLVNNPNKVHIMSNISDANVDNYNYDIVVENDGTLKDLYEKAKKFLEIIYGYEEG